jgi:hypothetical protein
MGPVRTSRNCQRILGKSGRTIQAYWIMKSILKQRVCITLLPFFSIRFIVDFVVKKKLGGVAAVEK